MRTAITISKVGLTPRTGVEAFFRRKQLFLWIVLTVVVATLLVTVFKPKQYSSEMKLLVQNTRGNVVITPERTTPSNVISDVSETQVNSELELLHSRDVVEPVADPGWTQIPAAERTPKAVRTHEKLIKAFEECFNTAVLRKTNVIDVSVLADTPEKAKSDLERLFAAYFAEHRRLQRPAGTSGFFQSEAERIRKDWDSASQRLVEFQKQNELISLPERESVLNNQITEHQRDLLTTDVTLRELDARLAESSRKLQEQPMRQVTVERVLPNQESSERLNTLLVEMENKRTAMLTNYKATDRTVRELDQQIATTKAALNNAIASTSHEQSSDVDPVWQQLHKDFVQTQISRRQTAAHREIVASELTALQQDLKNLQESTVQFNNLEAKTNQLKQNYELYAQKRDQAQIEDAMDEQKLLNVAVAQQPTLTYLPASPKPLRNAVMGFVTALFLAVCAVYLAEVGRTTIATPRELDGVSEYPILATIPSISLWMRRPTEMPEPHRPTLPAEVPANPSAMVPASTLLNPWNRPAGHA